MLRQTETRLLPASCDAPPPPIWPRILGRGSSGPLAPHPAYSPLSLGPQIKLGRGDYTGLGPNFQREPRPPSVKAFGPGDHSYIAILGDRGAPVLMSIMR